MSRFEVGISWPGWDRAQKALVAALLNARDSGVEESEALSALDDVYHEPDEGYEASPAATEEPPIDGKERARRFH